MATLKIGIATPAEMKARTLAIARGEMKPLADDPKVWFTSPESFAKVLSNGKRSLLDVIASTQPTSLQDLAASTGRKTSNLSVRCGQWSATGSCACIAERGDAFVRRCPASPLLSRCRLLRGATLRDRTLMRAANELRFRAPKKIARDPASAMDAPHDDYGARVAGVAVEDDIWADDADPNVISELAAPRTAFRQDRSSVERAL